MSSKEVPEKWALIFWVETALTTVISLKKLTRAVKAKNITQGWIGDIPWLDNGELDLYEGKILKISGNKKYLESLKASPDGKIMSDKDYKPALHKEKIATVKAKSTSKNVKVAGLKDLEENASIMPRVATLSSDSDDDIALASMFKDPKTTSVKKGTHTMEKLSTRLGTPEKASTPACSKKSSPVKGTPAAKKLLKSFGTPEKASKPISPKKSSPIKGTSTVDKSSSPKKTASASKPPSPKKQPEVSLLCKKCQECPCRSKQKGNENAGASDSPIFRQKVGVKDVMVELVQGSGIRVSQKDLIKLKTHAGGSPRALARGILIAILGDESKLVTMSARGGRHHDSIPQNVRDAICSYVTATCKPITATEFNDVVNKKCQWLRHRARQTEEGRRLEQERRRISAKLSREKKKKEAVTATVAAQTPPPAAAQPPPPAAAHPPPPATAQPSAAQWPAYWDNAPVMYGNNCAVPSVPGVADSYRSFVNL